MYILHNQGIDVNQLATCTRDDSEKWLYGRDKVFPHESPLMTAVENEDIRMAEILGAS